MRKTHSRRSHTMMSTYLKTVLYLLENYSCLLSDSEKLAALLYVSTELENTASEQIDHIITLRYSGIDPALAESPEPTKLAVVKCATWLGKLGEMETSYLEPSKRSQLLILQGMLQKNISLLTALQENKSLSHACQTGPE